MSVSAEPVPQLDILDLRAIVVPFVNCPLGKRSRRTAPAPQSLGLTAF
jgi:hypothetical protein